MLDVEFDPAKDEINIRKHGVSLRRAADLVIEAFILDTRVDYGEERFRAYGTIDGLDYCLGCTIRGERVRAISLRRAHAKEMRRHVPHSGLRTPH